MPDAAQELAAAKARAAQLAGRVRLDLSTAEIKKGTDLVAGDAVVLCYKELASASLWGDSIAGMWHPRRITSDGMVHPTEGKTYTPLFIRSGWGSFNMLVVSSAPTQARLPAQGHYPHKCSACGGKAYIGFTDVEHERTKGRNCE